MIRVASVVSFIMGVSYCWSFSHAEPPARTLLLVDKKTNAIHWAEIIAGHYQIRKSFHATLGKVLGDKEREGDLKTPEGIYIFKQKLMFPALKPKFGKMAFCLNYPNPYDQFVGRTGFDIMLHATNEPERLKQNYDSKGCVVIKDEEIEEVASSIRLGLTPILIFSELKPDDLNPHQDIKLRTFFEDWVRAWESKDIEQYIFHYHSGFRAQGKNRSTWRAYKQSLNKRYQRIHIGPENLMIYKHPKYSMITFTQNYQSKLNSGHWGHRSRGTKFLYVTEEAGSPKIIAETYTPLMW